MTFKNVANIGSVVTDKTIDSQRLLEMVNQARRQCGEPEVRNNKFIEKIEDELDGEHYTKSVVQKANKTSMVIIEMSIKQALRVAARESKAVRRSLVDQLESMQEAHIKSGKSASGLVEYRQARTLKMTVEAVTNLFDLMPNLAPEAKQTAAASIINPLVGFNAIPLPAIELKWSTKTGHRVRVFSSIDFPIRLVVTHHYIRAVLVRCNIQRYSPLLRELHR
ncbi:hypothetical protein G776_00320 [Escherichia coli HVH 115 (4-4465997)]|nr:hypothetical protein G777_01309 [Escherichia coli HVH 115 (4-4465989)]EQR11159.1 hypothetical protein G776_00320 [Escherichia coli HVH 115 (4-4465997)]